MKDKHIHAHMKSAYNYAECSTAERLKVGCVLVKDDRIISIGYNGMPSGWSNKCETLSFFTKDGKQLPSQILVTKPEVSHAEENAITKLAKSTESGEGATAFITRTLTGALWSTRIEHGNPTRLIIVIAIIENFYSLTHFQAPSVFVNFTPHSFKKSRPELSLYVLT